MFIEFYYALFLFLFFKDVHYNTMIRTFCILKKMTFSAFHYLTLSARCEELDAHINQLYLFLKSTYCDYILEKILSKSKVGPILALIAGPVLYKWPLYDKNDKDGFKKFHKIYQFYHFIWNVIKCLYVQEVWYDEKKLLFILRNGHKGP